MGKRVLTEKEKKINKEIKALNKIFEKIPEDKKRMCKSLIETSAYIIITLKELQELIDEEGFTVEYQNGKEQKGTRQNDNLKSHIAMTKNLTTIIKQLIDYLPTEQKQSTRLKAFARL